MPEEAHLLCGDEVGEILSLIFDVYSSPIGMTDPEVIQSAYENALRVLYAKFSDASIVAQNAAAKKAAAESFKHGVGIARALRDEALKIVGT